MSVINRVLMMMMMLGVWGVGCKVHGMGFQRFRIWSPGIPVAFGAWGLGVKTFPTPYAPPLHLLEGCGLGLGVQARFGLIPVDLDRGYALGFGI